MSEQLKIEVYFEKNTFDENDSAPPFICAVYGKITTCQLDEIEDDLAENWDYENTGAYTFRANYFSGQYGEYGYCELAPGWELDLVNFEPVEWSKYA